MISAILVVLAAGNRPLAAVLAAADLGDDVASGAVQLVADPAGWVPELADGLRRALA